MQCRRPFIGFDSTSGRWGMQHQSIECLDRLPAPRQRAPLVEVERNEAFQHGRLGYHQGQECAACTPHARDVDVRRRDAGREREALPVRAFAGNQARQRRDGFRPRAVRGRRPVEPVTARVLRRAGLAFRGARAGAALRVAAVGRGPDGADHHRSFRYPCGAQARGVALLRSNIINSLGDQLQYIDRQLTQS